ncbi:MAG: RdgB/HAM1 family non-canonical purine NTP pyrophosphatase [Candidatus Berkiellales bacterium]
MRVVLATANLGKLKEIQAFLSALPITLFPQSNFNTPAVEETGLSFVENAIIKARHAAKYSSLPALADDSGLCVDALNGEPGIYSARFAGPNATDSENIQQLLEKTATLEPSARRARFYCAMAFVRHPLDPIPLLCQGEWEGQLLTTPVGQNGFGYDPIFFVPDHHCSAAELSAAQKNKISHRAKALAQFVVAFKQAFPDVT